MNIGDDEYTLIDANDFKMFEAKVVTMTVILRVHWLPHGFKERVVRFLQKEADFLEMLDAALEKWEAGAIPIKN